MPKKELGGLPFPPLIKLDTNDPIEQNTLAEILQQRLEGVSICVRSAEGHANRGGYFFHIRPKDPTLDACDILNFERISVVSLPLAKLTAFINHCAGLTFDEESFQLCQTVINFRLDPEPSAEQDT